MAARSPPGPKTQVTRTEPAGYQAKTFESRTGQRNNNTSGASSDQIRTPSQGGRLDTPNRVSKRSSNLVGWLPEALQAPRHKRPAPSRPDTKRKQSEVEQANETTTRQGPRLALSQRWYHTKLQDVKRHRRLCLASSALPWLCTSKCPLYSLWLKCLL